MQTHICEATFVNQQSQMGLNKSSDKASSFCRKLEKAGRSLSFEREEASGPKIISDAWRCLITFYQSMKKKKLLEGRQTIKHT